MIHHHLNQEQREFVAKWLQEHTDRPSWKAYDKASRQIAKIAVTKKPSAKGIPNARDGYHANEVKLSGDTFSAIRDLPAGWALINCHDSGGNHRVINAGVSLLADLWNMWGYLPVGTTPPGSRLSRELEANNIPYPNTPP